MADQVHKGEAKVTGVTWAMVNLADGSVIDKHEGEDLDGLITSKEYDRLAALNVFGEHPRVARQRELEALQAAGLARNVAATGVLVPTPAHELDEDENLTADGRENPDLRTGAPADGPDGVVLPPEVGLDTRGARARQQRAEAAATDAAKARAEAQKAEADKGEG